MKKLFAGLISLAAALLAVCAITVCAGAETSGDYEYSVLDDGTVSITDYNGSATNLTIPSTIDGRKVKSIGYGAFESCSSLLSISLPDSLTAIGSRAFFCCSSLKSIIVPDSVTWIESKAFSGTPLLDNQTSTVKYVGKWAVDCDGEATTAEIKSGTVGIANEAFFFCDFLSSIIIPNSVKNIGFGAFEDCSSLVSIIIPDGVVSIENDTFLGCSSLTSIKIPDSVTSIGSYAFYGCESLKSINIPDSVMNIGSSFEGSTFQGCINLISINMPSKLTAIYHGTFSECSSLTTISIRDSVTSISSDAFFNCTNLASIEIPDSVTTIKSYAFNNCSSLKSIIIPSGVEYIGNGAFLGCSSLKDVYYSGSKEQWDKITIDEYNDNLINATIHYNYSVVPSPSSVTGLKLKARAADALRISWTKNTTADGYIIEMKDGTKWTRVGKITSNSTIEFKKSKLKAGTAYNFRIRAYKMDGKTALYSGYTTISARTNPSAVSSLKLKARAADALRLTWTKNTSADGYIIEMKSGNTWTRVGKITKNSTVEFKKSKLKAGTAYNFRIRAYKMGGKTALYSAYTTISARTNPSTTTGLKLKNSAKNAVRLSWTKNTSADGYIIEMKVNGTWTRVGKITKNSTVEFRKGSLKGKTSYTFRVKSYKMSGKTALYGATKTITVKTK